jgi:quercetin dioxygenase-like cupin family protein
VSPSYPSPAGRGQVFDNPVTGEHVVVLTDPYTNPDRALVSNLFARPGARVSGPHIHPESTERFHVVRGTVAFTIGGTERLLGPGEYAEVPKGVVHDWWQVGDEEARVVVEVTPGDRFAEIARTMIGLARDGKVTRRGAPSLLQLAVIMQEYRDVFVMASPPPWVQRPLFAVLALVGRLMGLRASYPKYLESTDIEEPAAEALALLDEHGRLRWNADARHLDLEL